MDKNLLVATLFLSFQLTFADIALAQGGPKENVSGTVTDISGETLPGAVITITGATAGSVKLSTMADIDGKYSIECAIGDVIVFQYLGMKSEKVTYNGKSPLDIVLQTDVSTTLDESVVIGYGSVRREDLTGSVSNVAMGDIRDSPVTSVDQALQGRIAGADVMTTSGEPGASTSIRIRGTRSITASNEPLIVVDGVMDAVSDIGDINPADIEDISVLKDASSTAIYGSRGANGVILITTKASASTTNSKPRITFKADAGISMLPSNLDMMNAAEHAIYRMDITDWENNRYTTPISQKQAIDPISRGEGTDWIKEVTRVAPYQNYYLSLSGGNGKTSYWASVGYSDNQGIIKKSGEKKLSTTFSISHQLFKFLKAGYKISYNRVLTQSTDASTQIALGGIVAKFAGNAYIHNCQNQGRVSLSGTTCNDVRMGGIAGLGGHAVLVAGEALVTYDGCKNYGNIFHNAAGCSEKSHVGGIYGSVSSVVSKENVYAVTIKNCVNKVAATNGIRIANNPSGSKATMCMGGIIGYTFYPDRLEGCKHYGEVSRAGANIARCGGFFGSNGGQTTTKIYIDTNCRIGGKVRGTTISTSNARSYFGYDTWTAISSKIDTKLTSADAVWDGTE